MTRNRTLHRITGLTLTEIIVAMAIVGVITLGIGILLANSQKNWGRLFGRVYSGTATDSFVVQQAFDTVCRKASVRKYVLSPSGDSLELYYWNSGSTASTPDAYARFYQDTDAARVDYGTLQTGTWQPDADQPSTTVTLANHIDSLNFTVEGTSIQLYLTYVDTDVLPVVCSSVRHND